MSDAARFWAKVSQPDAGCWEWQGSRTPLGYGQMLLGARKELAHRIAWQWTYGPIPKGLCVLHACDNPSCVRPGHLLLGTRAANMRDMVAKGRVGKQIGNRHGAKAMAPKMVRHIRARVEAGEPQAAVARELGLHQTTVNQICSRRRWASVI